MDTPNPLLLTLKINFEAQLYFNTLRQKYFPADRNFLDAHLMLFHQLPAKEESILKDVDDIVKHYEPILLRVTSLAGIGRGVAFKVQSDELNQLHRQLQTQWQHYLIPQDKQRLWPHITIQNKVTPAENRASLQQLTPEFKPFEITGTGIGIWEYKGGPWEFIRDWDFK
ncbi:2'-5' RNA ligase family protein [Mucilaginibacter sp.]|uniref:2'-5' RNA ligase family protein n=1 Tax=Mucilaginibacter sp. TaxID=1882438 RepID=UPI0035BC6E6F